MPETDKNPLGRVDLVGAGPGDPGMITLRAVACLARADVVLYDYLVNPRILRHARDDAELVCLGRHGKGDHFVQVNLILGHIMNLRLRFCQPIKNSLCLIDDRFFEITVVEDVENV